MFSFFLSLFLSFLLSLIISNISLFYLLYLQSIVIATVVKATAQYLCHLALALLLAVRTYLVISVFLCFFLYVCLLLALSSLVDVVTLLWLPSDAFGHFYQNQPTSDPARKRTNPARNWQVYAEVSARTCRILANSCKSL